MEPLRPTLDPLPTSLRPRLTLLAGAATLTLLAACDRSTASATAPQGFVYVDAEAPRPYFHDFGERMWGQTVEHTFQLVNREGREIVVQDLLPDCGCTIPRASWIGSDGVRVEGPLLPSNMDLHVPDGATLEVSIAIDTTRVERPNQHKLAQVRLRCDSAETPYLTFELHVLVKRAFRATPSEAILMDIPHTAGKSVRVNVSTEIAGAKARILGVESVDGPFTAQLSESQVNGETLWVLVVEAAPGLTHGAHTGKIALGTTLDDGTGIGQPFDVTIRGQVVADCIIEPRVLAIARDGAATSATLIALVPGAKVSVRSVRVEGGATDFLRATATAIDPDDAGRAARWRIEVEPLPDLPPQAFSGRLIAELDDPLLPRIEVPYAAPPR